MHTPKEDIYILLKKINTCAMFIRGIKCIFNDLPLNWIPKMRPLLAILSQCMLSNVNAPGPRGWSAPKEENLSTKRQTKGCVHVHYSGAGADLGSLLPCSRRRSNIFDIR